MRSKIQVRTDDLIPITDIPTAPSSAQRAAWKRVQHG